MPPMPDPASERRASINANTVGDLCTAGVCLGSDLCMNVTCSASDQCHVAGSCDYQTGSCSNPAAADGTVFLGVQVAQEAWILAVPDGGGAGPVLAQVAKSRFDDALTVEPAQVWALMPAPEGARAIDLTNGTFGPPVDFGCTWHDVSAIAPGSDGGALLIGECYSSGTRAQMLWQLAP